MSNRRIVKIRSLSKETIYPEDLEYRELTLHTNTGNLVIKDDNDRVYTYSPSHKSTDTKLTPMWRGTSLGISNGIDPVTFVDLKGEKGDRGPSGMGISLLMDSLKSTSEFRDVINEVVQKYLDIINTTKISLNGISFRTSLVEGSLILELIDTTSNKTLAKFTDGKIYAKGFINQKGD